MEKISEILEVRGYHILCKDTTGQLYEIDLKPLLHRHRHFEGIEKLSDPVFFQKVKIGEMGEICWEKCIKMNGELWNYDISPEFVVQNGKKIYAEA